MANNYDNIDEQLITKCKKGDGNAFRPLIKPYRKQLFTYLVRFCGEKESAEDLFQETLLKAWKCLPRYKHQNKFASWLFGIAYSVAIDTIRRKRSQEHIRYMEHIPDKPCTSDPFADVLTDEAQRYFESAILQLPEKQRQVFLLRQHGEISFKEIAAIMNQPLNTVLGHMHYAVSKLKKMLSEQDVV